MAKGYSVRYAKRECYNPKTGQFKLHSTAMWDERGYTLTFPTIEQAEQAAKELMDRRNDGKSKGEELTIDYCKIYLGREYIKTVEYKWSE